MTAEFMYGRTRATLDGKTEEYIDRLFTADRFDGMTIEATVFRHTTFANTSFKGVTVKECTFENVVFLSAYFRDARFIDCSFKACRFISCDLSRSAFQACDVRYYNTFRDCFIPFDRVKECLPREGNLLREIASNLADQAALKGAADDANKYREQSGKGEKDFLKAVIIQDQPFYKEKYTNWDRVTHSLRWAKIKTFELAWGRARRLEVIIRNWVIFAVIWAGILVLWNPTVIGAPVTVPQRAIIGFFSVSPIPLTVALSPEGWGAELFLIVGRVLGLVFSAIFATLLFARIYEGRR